MIKRNVVLVCGSRKYCDKELVYRVLDMLHSDEPFSLLVQGFAKNVDQTAMQWAEERGVPHTGNKYRITSSMWQKFGNGAGPWRNGLMLKNEKPTMVVAFPGQSGTKDMVEQSRRAFIRTFEVNAEGEIYENGNAPFFKP